jgi:hypothetical protein
MLADDLRHLRAAIALARRARSRGNFPFGALLVDPVGRVVFALSTRRLETPAVPVQDLLDLPCRDVFAHGSRPVVVAGPALGDEAAELFAGFWNSPDLGGARGT